MPTKILTKLQFQLSFLWGKKNPTSLGTYSLYVVVWIFSMCGLIMQPVCILYCTVAMVNFQPFLKQMMAGIHSAKSEFKLRDPKDLLTAGAVVEYTWQTLSYLSRNTVLANNCVRSIQKQQLVLKKRNNSNKIKSPGRKCCRHRVSTLQSRWDDWVSTAMCPTSLRGWIIHQGGWIITAERWRNPYLTVSLADLV